MALCVDERHGRGQGAVTVDAGMKNSLTVHRYHVFRPFAAQCDRRVTLSYFAPRKQE